MVYDFTHDLNCPDGGLGGRGGGFLAAVTAVALPLLQPVLKPPPGPPKPPPGLFRSRVKSHTTYFWTDYLIKARDYICSGSLLPVFIWFLIRE